MMQNSNKNWSSYINIRQRGLFKKSMIEAFYNNTVWKSLRKSDTSIFYKSRNITQMTKLMEYMRNGKIQNYKFFFNKIISVTDLISRHISVRPRKFKQFKQQEQQTWPNGYHRTLHLIAIGNTLFSDIWNILKNWL